MHIMYVCLCNSITETDIRGLARAGVTSAQDAYARLGCEFDCGHCEDFAQMLLDQKSDRIPAVSLMDPETLAASG